MGRLSQDRMILLALAVVDDAQQQARKGPIVRTNALRLALAYLFSQSDGRRGPYDLFWAECANPHAHAHSETMGNVMRGNWLVREWHGILQTLGLAPSIEFNERLRRVEARERAEFEALNGKKPPTI